MWDRVRVVKPLQATVSALSFSGKGLYSACIAVASCQPVVHGGRDKFDVLLHIIPGHQDEAGQETIHNMLRPVSQERGCVGVSGSVEEAPAAG